MSHYAHRIAPILRELDEILPLNRPVPINVLLDLFKRHAQFEKIEIVLVQSIDIRGVHLAPRGAKRATLYVKRCEVHFGDEPDPGCPGCQWERYTIAKELVHTLDREEEWTSPTAIAGAVIDQLIRRALHESPQAMADGWGQVWAIELLARFRHRLLHVHPQQGISRAVAQARAGGGDYSYLARQYGVPQQILSHGFSDQYMEVMGDIRKEVGLLVTVPPLD